MKKTIMVSFAILILTVCLLSISLSFSEELMPEPGTVIDKTNIKKYAHLFPAEIVPAFEDGFGGIIEPVSIKIAESKITEYSQTRAFLALSTENKGKYSLDAEGNIVGGWQRNGSPFPDLQRDDKDFVTKFMWNWYGRYYADDLHTLNFSYLQRRGETVKWNYAELKRLYFSNRLVCSPKPLMENPNGLAWGMCFHFKEPSNVRNMMTLTLRYKDLDKPDEVYIYIPTLRRVLRGDSGQRAVPLQGNLAALDDIDLFDGKTDEFTYQLVGEQKIVAALETTNLPVSSNRLKLEKIPYPSEPCTVTDVYVIDITSKNPVYPQSKKRIWVDKNATWIYYAVTWDRAGKLWKVWYTPASPMEMPGDNPFPTSTIGFGIDLQFGMANLTNWSVRPPNACDAKWEDFSPASLVKKAN